MMKIKILLIGLIIGASAAFSFMAYIAPVVAPVVVTTPAPERMRPPDNAPVPRYFIENFW